MRSKAFFINGGAGRVVCSIPALEKYAETHDDFIIVCEGGTDFFKGHPVLHNKVYDNWHKGLFEDYIKSRDCVSPEPYREWNYYNQKCSLTQAFDIIINNLDGPREIKDPSIHLSKMEAIAGFNTIDEVKAVTGKDKVLVVQPFGRSVEQVGNDFIADPSSRSFSLTSIVDIINELKKDYGIVIMSEVHFPLEENEEKSQYKVARPQISDIRLWAGIINAADHFLGCDSVGQHIAKAFGKTATVVTGSTYPINISYPDSNEFDIIDVGLDRRKYAPIRISMDEEIDRYNDQAMEMTNDQIKSVIESVRKRMGKSVAYTNYNSTKNNQPTTPSINLPSGNNKPVVKKSKGFLNELQNTHSGSNLNSQVTDVLKNLK
jgi:hypothetical protein